MFKEESARFVSGVPEVVRPSISIMNIAPDLQALFEEFSARTATLGSLVDSRTMLKPRRSQITSEIHRQLELWGAK